MTKITLSVCKVFKNSGSLRFHRDKTKKHWKHYFIDIDEDEEEYSFGSEWVSSFKAIILKRKQLYKKQFICLECGSSYANYVKKNQDEDDNCPNCNE